MSETGKPPVPREAIPYGAQTQWSEQAGATREAGPSQPDTGSRDISEGELQRKGFGPGWALHRQKEAGKEGYVQGRTMSGAPMWGISGTTPEMAGQDLAKQ